MHVFDGHFLLLADLAHRAARGFLGALLLLGSVTPSALATQHPAPKPSEPTREAALHVACVGDSITFGSGLPDREHTTYPLVLGALLGDGYEVRNFGVSGATLLANGDRPYVKEGAYREALRWSPDVVVILLGTNDSKLHNWAAHGAEFEADYADLVASFRARTMGDAPRILLCVPTPAWTSGDSIDGGRIANEVVPKVRRVAAATGCELIDFHTPFGAAQGWFPDGVHPNPAGAEAMARRVLEAVELRLDPSLDLARGLTDAGVAFTEVDFHGFRQLDFERAGVACHLVLPRVAAEGAPWIWRARFFGHEPQADRALLERGWHVGYCEVGGLFGAPSAVARWDDFYAFVRGLGLDARPVLEGMSRGGLIVYNWARAHPDRVAGIYADNPVLDPRSWPGGAGASERREADWAACLAAYGVSELTPATTPSAFPLEDLAPLAAAGIPLLHVIGESDSVVPVPENSDLLEARYLALGGSIRVLRKPGMDHHPHSLVDPQPIVDFALAATGRRFNPCTRPQPSVEWRGAAAGWGAGTWLEEVAKIEALASANPGLRLVFFGDSITQGWTGAADRLGHAGGPRAFDRWYGKRDAASFGLSGDRTEHLLYRIRAGAFRAIDPEVIVLMIGVNNLNTAGDDGASTAAGIASVVAALRAEEPQAEVLLLGCFPTKEAGSWARRESEVLHARIAPLGELEHVHYLDIRDRFLLPDGTLDPATMRDDGVHITAAGYEAWAEAIEPTLRELLGE